MAQSLHMPFRPMELDAVGETALDEIEALTEAARTAEDARRAKVPRLITRAHDHGASYDVIAERMGVSRQRVRQIEGGK